MQALAFLHAQYAMDLWSKLSQKLSPLSQSLVGMIQINLQGDPDVLKPSHSCSVLANYC